MSITAFAPATVANLGPGFDVLGMAIAYALVGVLFGFLGASIQPFLQLPWVIILFSIVLVLPIKIHYGHP